MAVAAGLALGAGLTAYTVRLDAVGAVRVGPWRLLTDAGTPGINPYLRARYARTGAIPLAASEGILALAATDEAGAPLDRRCVYRVAGPVPPSLLWTLAAVDRNGEPFDNPAGRRAFTSAEVIRDATGAAVIIIAAAVEPGNWLPVTGTGPFQLALRLYDSRAATVGARGLAMPTIETLRCA